jgi:hypothetical protein
MQPLEATMDRFFEQKSLRNFLPHVEISEGTRGLAVPEAKTAAYVGRLEGERGSGAFSRLSNECGVLAPQILREEKMYLWQ